MNRLGVVLAGVIVAAGLAVAAGAGPSTYTFDGAPATPQLFVSLDWDVTIFVADYNDWYTPQPVAAQHGADCSAPPASHPVTEYANLKIGRAHV